MKDIADFQKALAAAIAQHSKDELAAKEGMVTQVWSDGEVTSQKSGMLLNQRTLHQMNAAFIKTSTFSRDGEKTIVTDGMDGPWPHWKETPDRSDPNHIIRQGFIYTDDLGVAALAELMIKYCIFDAIRRTAIAGMQMIPVTVSFTDKDGKKLSSMQASYTWIDEQLKNSLEKT